ncbi:MAG: CTB family bacteriocin [Fischerella sp.]|nr:CTB family bacteriocin [Fischerella sp.]
MPNEIFASELFTDIAEEQQELVAGGSYDYYKYPAFEDTIKTLFNSKENAFMLDTDVVASKQGAAVSQKFAAQKAIYSAEALKKIFFTP